MSMDGAVASQTGCSSAARYLRLLLPMESLPSHSLNTAGWRLVAVNRVV